MCVCVQACTCFQFWSLFLLKSYIVEIIGENMKRMIALPRRESVERWSFFPYIVFFFGCFNRGVPKKVLSRRVKREC